MTSFHTPGEEEIAAHRAALDCGNIVHLPIKPQPSRPTAAPKAVPRRDAEGALAVAEGSRKLCLEAAACFAELLRTNVLSTPHITPERVGVLLTRLAAEIRSLKLTGEGA